MIDQWKCTVFIEAVQTDKRKTQEQAEQQQFEMIKVVGESLKSMCDSMRQQPQSGKKHEDEDDLFGVFVASQLKCMNPAKKARAKYHIDGRWGIICICPTASYFYAGF